MGENPRGLLILMSALLLAQCFFHSAPKYTTRCCLYADLTHGCALHYTPSLFYIPDSLASSHNVSAEKNSLSSHQISQDYRYEFIWAKFSGSMSFILLQLCQKTTTTENNKTGYHDTLTLLLKDILVLDFFIESLVFISLVCFESVSCYPAVMD